MVVSVVMVLLAAWQNGARNPGFSGFIATNSGGTGGSSVYAREHAVSPLGATNRL